MNQGLSISTATLVSTVRAWEQRRHDSQATEQTAGKPMIITIQWFQEMSGDNNVVKDPLLLVLTRLLGDWRYQNEVTRRGRVLVWILQLAGPPCEHSHYNLESWLGDFYKYNINIVQMAANVITNMPRSFSTPCLHWHKDQISLHQELRASSNLLPTPEHQAWTTSSLD